MGLLAHSSRRHRGITPSTSSAADAGQRQHIAKDDGRQVVGADAPEDAAAGSARPKA